MNYSALDFNAGAVAPYLLACVLLLRRHFRRDGSGNRKQGEDSFAQTALYLAYGTLVLPIIFVTLRFMHIFIPYGTIMVSAVGVVWASYTIWLQRRPPSAEVQSRELLGERAQKLSAKAAGNQFKTQSAKRVGR